MVRYTGEDLINEEGVAVASMLSVQTPSIYCAKFDAPEANRFSNDDCASLWQEIFNIAVTEIEPEVEPDCIADDVGWEPMALICIHSPILVI